MKMKNNQVLFNYSPPHQLAANLWEIRGEWKNKLGRRMTVIKLADDSIFIHNAIRLNAAELDWLKNLGSVQYVVAPNTFHCSDAGWMLDHFQNAQLFVPLKKISDFEKQGFKPKNINGEFPKNISSELSCFSMVGSKMEEAAFIHHPSKTLIFCDLAFNMADVFTGFEKIIMNLNKVGIRFGPSRITKLLFTKNTGELIQSYKNILTQDFDRVIVNHGDVLPSNGKNLLRKSVQEIFGDF